MTPLDRLFAVPADVVNAIAMIPAIARNTKAMERHTSSLHEVTRAIKSVSTDTEALPSLLARMDTVAEMTSILPPMDGRMATIEDTMPALLEVQRHLAQLPETMETLNGLLERMLVSLDELSESVSKLQGAVSPVGRLASRLPGQKADK